MNPEAKHTPTTWTIIDRQGRVEIKCEDGTSIAFSPRFKARAEGIVRAVNTHQGLVDALQSIATQSLGADWTAQQAFDFMRTEARKALALAKGER